MKQNLLEKPTVSQLVKEFPTIYGTRRLITNITTAHHLSLSRARSRQSTPPMHYFRKMDSYVKLPSTPRSSKLSLSLRFPHQNPVCTTPLTQTFQMPCLPHLS